jgi:hypothetical protein
MLIANSHAANVIITQFIISLKTDNSELTKNITQNFQNNEGTAVDYFFGFLDLLKDHTTLKAEQIPASYHALYQTRKAYKENGSDVDTCVNYQYAINAVLKEFALQEVSKIIRAKQEA